MLQESKQLSIMVLVLATALSLNAAAQAGDTILLSCPSISFNETIVQLNFYQAGQPSCTGLSESLQYSNGTFLPTSFISQLECASGRARYSLSFPQSGKYTFTASAASASESCEITYKKVDVFPKRVPEFDLFLLPLFGFLAFLAQRKIM